MPGSGVQISALHLAVAASGGVLLYAAFQGVTPLEALKDMTSGKTPEPIRAKGSTLRGTASPASFGGGSDSALLSAAQRYLGVDYVWGGTTPQGLDCSGLVVLSFLDAYGVTPPRTTYGQEVWRELRRIDRGELVEGDLVFWAGHVAIYAGEGRVIHAPRPGTVVKYSPIDSAGPGRITSYQRYRGASSTGRYVET